MPIASFPSNRWLPENLRTSTRQDNRSKLELDLECKSCCYHTKLAADGWAKCQMRKADASGKVLFFFQSISFFAASLTA